MIEKGLARAKDDWVARRVVERCTLVLMVVNETLVEIGACHSTPCVERTWLSSGARDIESQVGRGHERWMPFDMLLGELERFPTSP